MKATLYFGGRIWRYFRCATLLLIVAPCPVLAQLGDLSRIRRSSQALLVDSEKKQPMTTSSFLLEPAIAQYIRARENIYVTMMSDERRLLVQVTGLDDVRARALEEPSRSAVGTSLQEWAARARNSLQQSNLSPGGTPKWLLTSPRTRALEVAQQGFMLDVLPPAEQSVWTEAIKATLSADEFAKWIEFRNQRTTKLEKELETSLPGLITSAVQQQMQPLLSKSAEVRRDLSLPSQEAELVDCLAESVAEPMADALRARAQKMVHLGEGPPTLALLLQPEYFGAPGAASDPADLEAAWNARLGEVLSSDALTALEEARHVREERRNLAAAHVSVAEIDEQVALTPSQRAKLEPLAMRLPPTRPSISRELIGGNGIVVITSPSSLNRNITDDSVRSILEPSQWQRWQTFCKSSRPASQAPAPKRPFISQVLDRPRWEPEEIERRFSEFFYQASELRRTAYLQEMMLKTDDVARATGLSDAARDKLQTAARGVVEERMTASRTELEQSPPNSPDDALAAGFLQLPANPGKGNVPRAPATVAEQQDRWTKTLEQELDPAQRAAWAEALESRRRYRHAAIKETVLAAIDRKVTLSSQQWSKLEPKIDQFISEYGSDLSAYYSGTVRSSAYAAMPWYSHPYFVYLPLAGIPLAEINTILEKDQWDQWNKSPERASVERTWPLLKKSHDEAVAAGQ